MEAWISHFGLHVFGLESVHVKGEHTETDHLDCCVHIHHQITIERPAENARGHAERRSIWDLLSSVANVV